MSTIGDVEDFARRYLSQDVDSSKITVRPITVQQFIDREFRFTEGVIIRTLTAADLVDPEVLNNYYEFEAVMTVYQTMCTEIAAEAGDTLRELLEKRQPAIHIQLPAPAEETFFHLQGMVQSRIARNGFKHTLG